jgi:hypothetical protein
MTKSAPRLSGSEIKKVGRNTQIRNFCENFILNFGRLQRNYQKNT